MFRHHHHVRFTSNSSAPTRLVSISPARYFGWIVRVFFKKIHLIQRNELAGGKKITSSEGDTDLFSLFATTSYLQNLALLKRWNYVA